MNGTNLELRTRIGRSLRKVETLFLRQCEHGAQTSVLEPNHAACGQFIGQGADGNAQRGLHGIAAALRVLSSCPSDAAQRMVQRLVSYCAACFDQGANGQATTGVLSGNALSNIIKLGELLYALSFVTGIEAERLTQHVIARLESAQLRHQGWGHFLDSTKCELLPSAYAIRGLAAHGRKVTEPTEWILTSLKKRRGARRQSHADVTTAVACAYCLTFPRHASGDETLVAETFADAWTVLEQTFTEDLEQNLEYSHKGENHYVRVPMQLYLLALACDYGQWKFASLRAVRRLDAVVAAVEESSFKYPYSGEFLSSRTNAIAYEVLGIIEEKLRTLRFVQLASRADSFRVTLGSWRFRMAAATAAVVVVGAAIWRWSGENPTIGQLAPGLINAALVAILAMARK